MGIYFFLSKEVIKNQLVKAVIDPWPGVVVGCAEQCSEHSPYQPVFLNTMVKICIESVSKHHIFTNIDLIHYLLVGTVHLVDKLEEPVNGELNVTRS